MSTIITRTEYLAETWTTVNIPLDTNKGYFFNETSNPVRINFGTRADYFILRKGMEGPVMPINPNMTIEVRGPVNGTLVLVSWSDK